MASGPQMVSKTKETQSSVQRRDGESERSAKRKAKGAVVEDDGDFLEKVGMPLATFRGGQLERHWLRGGSRIVTV